jgi:hypothetical protein
MRVCKSLFKRKRGKKRVRKVRAERELKCVTREACGLPHEVQDGLGLGFDGEETEGEARGAEPLDEAEALETVGRASEEVVGHGLRDEAVGAIRGWGEAEAVQI